MIPFFGLTAVIVNYADIENTIKYFRSSGQDFIPKFSEIILNFDDMYIEARQTVQ
jgi:hypothetical protein